MESDEAAPTPLSLADRSMGWFLAVLALTFLVVAWLDHVPWPAAAVVTVAVLVWIRWLSDWRSVGWAVLAAAPLGIAAWDPHSFLLLWLGLMLYLVVVSSLTLQPTRRRTVLAVVLELLLYAAVVYPWVHRGRGP